MADDAPLELLKAIAHPLRYAILSVLAGGRERNVGEIEDATGIGQPTLSQQLSILRREGLVDSRREAKLVFYTIDQEAIGRGIGTLAALAPAGTQAPPKSAGASNLTGAAVFARLD